MTNSTDTAPSWKRLTDLYGPELVQKFSDRAAKTKGVRDPLAWAAKALEAEHGAELAGPAREHRLAATDKMPCDSCDEPEWVNNLRVPAGDWRALCGACRPKRQAESDRNYSGICVNDLEQRCIGREELIRLVEAGRVFGKALPILAREEAEWDLRFDQAHSGIRQRCIVMAGSHVEREAKAREMVKDALARLGPRPVVDNPEWLVRLLPDPEAPPAEAMPHPTRELTPLAKRVKAYWALATEGGPQ